MSTTRGIDVSLLGTVDRCTVNLWYYVDEARGNAFIGGTDPGGAPYPTTFPSVEDYGWGAYDNIAVKFILLFKPLITGLWSFGIPSRDDLGGFTIREGGDPAGKIIASTTDTNYQTCWMLTGNYYWMEYRWYEHVGPGNFGPRFKYPGNATERVIQTTTSICQILLYNGYADNTPLLSIDI